MSATRSSVRPSSSKQPWGTILKPNFGLGYQKMTDYEVEQTVKRLYTIKTVREAEYPAPEMKSMSSAEIDTMVGRLTTEAGSKAPDTNRTQQNSIYKHMGPVNSFAWKGYN